MSLPQWNDLPAEARKAATTLLSWWGISDPGQCAVEVYAAICEHSHLAPERLPSEGDVPPGPRERQGLAAISEDYALVPVALIYTLVQDSPPRTGLTQRTVAQIITDAAKLRVRVHAGRRVL